MHIACCIEYSGAGYHGWQVQDHASSIQGTLESALAAVADSPVRVIAAGRTDTGVHACAQIIHFDTGSARDAYGWLRGTNTHLPSDIRVIWVKPVEQTFHARYGAQRRSYRYVIHNRPVASAYLANQVTWHRQPLDIEAMTRACQYIVGEHDFSAFRAARCQNKNPVKNIQHLSIQQKGEWIWLDITASGFLHHMVRNIVGTLSRIGEGLESPRWMGEVLDTRDRRCAAMTAPPNGLYFTGASYDATFELPELPSACRFW